MNYDSKVMKIFINYGKDSIDIILILTLLHLNSEITKGIHHLLV